MRIRGKILIFSLFINFILLFPLPAFGSVFVDEIAWMGSNNGGSGSANAADEWIELANDSNQNVSLDGWILRILDKKDISLSGMISGNGFYLIERTDDNSVPSVTADVVSSFGTGGLKNSGETIQLINDLGEKVDEVISGENWSLIGGDNETKNTAQKQNGVWITASPSPASSNLPSAEEPLVEEESPVVVEEEVVSSGTTSVTNDTGKGGSPLVKKLKIIVEAPDVSVAGVPISFKGFAFGDDNVEVNKARYIYSFGDGSTGESQNLYHTYFLPGTYVVFLSASTEEMDGSGKHIIKVISADIVISSVKSGSDGFVELKNNSSNSIDLSKFVLRGGGKEFVIPQNTIILPKSSLRFSSLITKLFLSGDSNVSILYPNGSLLNEYTEDRKEVEIVPVVSMIKKEDGNIAEKDNLSIKTENVDKNVEEIKASIKEEGDVLTDDLPDTEIAKMTASLGDVSKENSSSALFGVLILCLIGISAFLVVKGKGDNEEEAGASGGKLTADDIRIIE